MGIAAAFLGIVVAFVGPGSRPVPELIVGDLLALLEALRGIEQCRIARGRVGGANTAKTVLYQVGVATWCYSGSPRHPDRPSVLSGRRSSRCCSDAVYLDHQLSRLVLAAAALFDVAADAAVAADTLFGVLFGALLLGEPIESRFAIGSLLVLAEYQSSTAIGAQSAGIRRTGTRQFDIIKPTGDSRAPAAGVDANDGEATTTHDLRLHKVRDVLLRQLDDAIGRLKKNGKSDTRCTMSEGS